MGYLMLLCQSLVACGQRKDGAGGGASRQQYQQLPVQDERPESSSQKGHGRCEGGPATVELTVSAAQSV